MKKNNRFHLNIGTSSILFIFIVLALVSFAVLSLETSLSDYNLSRNVADNTTAYYTACNAIEDQLAQTDQALKELYDTGISRVGFYEQTGKTRSFAYPVSDIRSLSVTIDILYPEASGDPFYQITSWQVITTGSLELDTSLPVAK